MDYQLYRYNDIQDSNDSLLTEVYQGDILIPKEFPKIVCLCGSTRFWQEFQDAAEDEILKGNIVVSVGIRYREGNKHFDRDSESRRKVTKEGLDWLHKRKIDMADEVVIINKDGYIGESTRGELEYAQSKGKVVSYVYPVS